jgi:hypothetical protein
MLALDFLMWVGIVVVAAIAGYSGFQIGKRVCPKAKPVTTDK